jgi:predicted unusual protein kinase regulating ubiquinone biosynthesis (AarF/ABC1/UbiB family)
MSLLVSNELGRMILVGGQNAIEMTSRWGQFDTADSLLDIWLDVAVSQNDIEAVLNFADDSVRKKDLWTITRLMDKVLEMSHLSASQHFVAQALRCLCLERLCEMLDNPDRIKNELDAVQAGWVSRHTDFESLRTSAGQGIIEAKQLFTAVDKPTREQKVLRAQLEKIQPLIIR